MLVLVKSTSGQMSRRKWDKLFHHINIKNPEGYKNLDYELSTEDSHFSRAWCLSNKLSKFIYFYYDN